jgi:hypothetical protein
MSNSFKQKSITGKRQGDKSEIVLSEQEVKRHFTPNELKAYNELYPNFGKEYLKNLIELPREYSKQNQRFHNLFKTAMIVSISVVLFFISTIVFLLLNGYIQYAVYLIFTCLGGIVIAFLSYSRKDKK